MMTGDVLPSQVGATELSTDDDPYLWLEDIASERSLAWVREQNAATVRELGTSGDFEALRQRLLAIFDSKERIPGVAKDGAYYYNFWRDATHVRGLWRRTRSTERPIRHGRPCLTWTGWRGPKAKTGFGKVPISCD